MGYSQDTKLKQPESVERTLMQDLWRLLKGDKHNTISYESFRVIAQVIQKVIDPKRVQNVPDKPSEKSAFPDMELGFLNEKDELCLRFTEVPKIQTHFNLFYLN